jgi:hypothetical protein
MSDAASQSEQTRGAGLLLLAAGLASVGLLALHPGGSAREFADVLKQEAASRVMDAVVHGGFVVVLVLELIGYAALSRRLGFNRLPALAGFVLFAAGAILFSGSLIMDGLVTPAVATRYLAAPEKIDLAKSLFVLMGATIGVLMPAGLLFQSLGIASWGLALLSSPSPSRAAGVLAVTIGGVLTAALAVTVAAMDPIVLMAGIVFLAIWSLAAGAVLMTRAS